MEPTSSDVTSATPASPWDLSALIKSYDVRGIVPEPFSPAVAEAIGAAFATVVVIPDAGDAADATPPGLDGPGADASTVSTGAPVSSSATTCASRVPSSSVRSPAG